VWISKILDNREAITGKTPKGHGPYQHHEQDAGGVLSGEGDTKECQEKTARECKSRSLANVEGSLAEFNVWIWTSNLSGSRFSHPDISD